MTSSSAEADVALATLRRILKSQYRASLAMFREAVEQCSDDLWMDSRPANACWQIAYHTVFFAHLYLLPNENAFRPWARHQTGVQNEDGIAGEPDPKSALPLIPNPYSRIDVLDYCTFCEQMLDAFVDALDLHSPDCGFSWYRVSKLEHQFVNIRHIQHHTAQLADRLRAARNVGVRWVGARTAAAG